MVSILFLEICDCYTFPNICCLPLQQIFFVYQFKREVFVSTGSLLLQHIHSVCVLNTSQQDSMDTQNILKPYEQNVYFPRASKN